MLCDSQLWEVSIITGLQGTAEFLSCVEKMNRSFGIHKKHSSMVPLPADKYEANIRSERTPQMARMEPYLPRQPPWFKCFLMVSRSWIPTFNWWMEISMEIWKVAWLDKWNLFMLPIITNMTQVRMSLTMPEDLANSSERNFQEAMCNFKTRLEARGCKNGTSSKISHCSKQFTKRLQLYHTKEVNRSKTYSSERSFN